MKTAAVVYMHNESSSGKLATVARGGSRQIIQPFPCMDSAVTNR